MEAAAVPVGAPEGVDLAQIPPALPVLAVDGLAHPCAVGAGWAAEHPQGCLLQRLIFAQALGHQPLPLLVGVLFDKVLLRGLIQAGHGQHRPLHQLHHVGEGVPEQAADAQHRVDAGAAQLRQGDGLHPHHLVRLAQIAGAHTHQGEHLCDVLSVGFHALVGVDHDRYTLRPGFPLLGPVGVDRLLRQRLSHRPCRPAGYGGGVDGVKVPARGQDVDIPPGGTASGQGRDKAPLHPRQQQIQLVRGLAQPGRRLGADKVQHPRQRGGVPRKALLRQELRRSLRPVALRRQAGNEPPGRRNRPVHNAQGGAPVGVEPLRRGPQLLGRPPLGQQYAVLQGGHGAIWHPHQGSGQVVEALPLWRLAVDVQAVPHQGGLDAAHPAVEAGHPLLRLGLQIRPLQLEIGSHLQLLRQGEDPLQQCGHLGRPGLAGVIVAVDGLVQIGEAAVSVRVVHGGDQVVEYAGAGAALPQDADVVNVEVGHPADADVSEAAGGQADLLAR